ncbi:MAG: methionine biosynthesis protein MetW [Desulfobulbus sp.]|jgi:methionine biosynthesis protein MetW|uniref:methionine biosynthesis protein MetW n=1 Tax=Desulfobulbus sp. TaxID=895 RepID=UPI00283CC2DE|nr:methionine biosynthesis protein MetW [Desulfobulbus sp.]MDR2548682.1 methionine biosynthesis protein MetW [Desulfobulbus sp.]
MNVVYNPELGSMRFDLQVIASWIEPGSRVLDLGCGAGDLLDYLKQNRQVAGTGIELSEEKAARCIERGLTVLQGDFRREVRDYPEGRFDVVVLSQTLQQITDPKELLTDLLWIGKRVIVSFPNFAHWSARLQFLLTGMAPITDQLPYEWYNTPNIRVISINDFKRFLRLFGVRIVREVAINTHHHDYKGNIVRTLKNLRATYGIMMLERVG